MRLASERQWRAAREWRCASCVALAARSRQLRQQAARPQAAWRGTRLGTPRPAAASLLARQLRCFARNPSFARKDAGAVGRLAIRLRTDPSRRPLCRSERHGAQGWAGRFSARGLAMPLLRAQGILRLRLGVNLPRLAELRAWERGKRYARHDICEASLFGFVHCTKFHFASSNIRLPSGLCRS